MDTEGRVAATRVEQKPPSLGKLGKPPPGTRMARFKQTALQLRMTHAEMLVTQVLRWLEAMDDVSLEAAADGLAHAKRLRRRAYRLEKAFEEATVAAMMIEGETIRDGEGYRAFLRPGSRRKAWDDSAVLEALSEKVFNQMNSKYPFIDPGPLGKVINHAMWAIRKVARLQWRATELREIELEPGDYSSVSIDGPSVDVRGQSTYAQREQGSGPPRARIA